MPQATRRNPWWKPHQSPQERAKRARGHATGVPQTESGRRRKAERQQAYYHSHQPGTGSPGCSGCGCVVLLAFGLAFSSMLLATGCGPVGRPAASSTTSVATKTFSRDEFKQLVIGKTEAEVKAAVGGPDKTSDNGHAVCWEYKQRTVDPTTGKTDRLILVFFKDGKVDSITF